MDRVASINERLILLASIVAAIGFYFARDLSLNPVAMTIWKGAGVGLLAAYALLWRDPADFRLLSLIMAFSAVGDMILGTHFQLGAAFFLASHVTAIALYFRHRRDSHSPSQKIAAIALLLLTPLIAFLLPADRAQAPEVAVYAFGLGGMACAAWLSSFPRYRVGIGAVLFVVSDLLIFAQMGPLVDSPLPGLLIWPTYYVGQFLICTGVASSLRRHSPG
jgi:uncharacterized membrane protein YhhN